MKIEAIETMNGGTKLYLRDDNENRKVLHVIDGSMLTTNKDKQSIICVKYSSYNGEWFLLPGEFTSDSLVALSDYLESNNLTGFYQDLEDMEKLVDDEEIEEKGYYEALAEYGESMGWIHETINDFWFDIFEVKDIKKGHFSFNDIRL